MKMKRCLTRAAGLVLIFLMLAGCLAFAASAESLHVRKIVSVVYDDSNSMKNGDKWAYANYAMQTFCGMLDSEDRLFISYMSGCKKDSYSGEEIPLTPDRIQSAVDSVRAHTDSSSTPFKAVEVAYDRLCSVRDDDPNTQYWLVVITDGDFNECQREEEDEKKKAFLNERFAEIAKEKMPNGTAPQITFLAIGEDLVSPDEDRSAGIFTYTAKDAQEIVGAMSAMADKVSGRTRLADGDIRKTDARTLQVASSIPLLNIVVLEQGGGAKIIGAARGGAALPIRREVSLRYEKLNGGACQIGDSQSAIGAGEYQISFDRDVDAERIVVLFEPALEIRTSVRLNGEEVRDPAELSGAAERDTVRISCDVYEMGTDTVVDEASLPEGTTFQITVSEDGREVLRHDGRQMPDACTLKDAETAFTASMRIPGFLPIERTLTVSPHPYVPTYTVRAQSNENVGAFRYQSIGSDREPAVYFTVYADGVPVTDPDAVRALDPSVTVLPQGNAGSVTYGADGRIAFVPEAAPAWDGGEDLLDAEVTCALPGGASAVGTYTVLYAEYAFVPVAAEATVRKNAFFGNTQGVSFYLTRNGTRQDRHAVESTVTAELDAGRSDLRLAVTVADDGMLTAIPYSDTEYSVTPRTWWTNWWHYFRLDGRDASVILRHPSAEATGGIRVIGAAWGELLRDVILPLFTELVILAAIVLYIVRCVTKPRFAKGAKLYVGQFKDKKITFNNCVSLKNENSFFKLWNRYRNKWEDMDIRFEARRSDKIHYKSPRPVQSGLSLDNGITRATVWEECGEVVYPVSYKIEYKSEKTNYEGEIVGANAVYFGIPEKKESDKFIEEADVFSYTIEDS